MMSDAWIKKWVIIKIKYYRNYLKNNQDSPIRNEIKESIRILKELI